MGRRRQYGVLVRLRVQLTYGLVAPRTNRPRCRTPPQWYPVSCDVGRAKRGGETDMVNTINIPTRAQNPPCWKDDGRRLRHLRGTPSTRVSRNRFRFKRPASTLGDAKESGDEPPPRPERSRHDGRPRPHDSPCRAEGGHHGAGAYWHLRAGRQPTTEYERTFPAPLPNNRAQRPGDRTSTLSPQPDVTAAPRPLTPTLGGRTGGQHSCLNSSSKHLTSRRTLLG